MPTIFVDVSNKIARAREDNPAVVCGNSDYVAEFAFDDEWSGAEIKTARFVCNHKYYDIVFTGTACPVPAFSDAYGFSVGVFAGDLQTTTPAQFPLRQSILCNSGTPAPPTEDVYTQLIEMIEAGMLQGPQGDKGDAPEKGVDYWTAADKAEIVQEVMAALPAAEEVQF